jgi:hypothetical protein
MTEREGEQIMVRILGSDLMALLSTAKVVRIALVESGADPSELDRVVESVAKHAVVSVGDPGPMRLSNN